VRLKFPKINLPIRRKSFGTARGERVKINFFGKLYIGFTLLVGFAAVNTGNNILYILLSFLLALMAVSGFLSRYNLRGLKVFFSPPNEVWCCKKTRFDAMVKNLKRLPSFLLTVEEADFKLSARLPIVERSETAVASAVFPRRGLYKLKKIRIVSTFPFGLFLRSWEIPIDEEILVFPKPAEVAIPPTILNSLSDVNEGFLSLKVRKLYGDTVEGLREYGGEGLRLIDWKVFARLGEFYAKELSSDEILREVTIDVDKIPASDVEERISKATYLVLKFERLGYAVGLKFGKKEMPPSAEKEHFARLLRFLALA
jgi:uncharacterized protein (DUF58 family)